LLEVVVVFAGELAGYFVVVVVVVLVLVLALEGFDDGFVVVSDVFGVPSVSCDVNSL